MKTLTIFLTETKQSKHSDIRNCKQTFRKQGSKAGEVVHSCTDIRTTDIRTPRILEPLLKFLSRCFVWNSARQNVKISSVIRQVTGYLRVVTCSHCARRAKTSWECSVEWKLDSKKIATEHLWRYECCSYSMVSPTTSKKCYHIGSYCHGKSKYTRIHGTRI